MKSASRICCLTLLISSIFVISALSGCNLVKTETIATSPKPSDTKASPTATVATSPTLSDTKASPTETLPSGTNLDFSTISIRHEYTENPVYTRVAKIVIISSKPVNNIEGITLESTDRINEVDFSKHFVLVLFHGTTYPGNGIQVERIWQNEKTIYILAQFQKTGVTVIPIDSGPYVVVQIVKDSLTQFGQTTFVLLDESGKERAEATYEITN
jgi:hypothetical protein